MGRLVRVGIVVLAVVAIATVLATPDPTDDVSGVLNGAQIHFSLLCIGPLLVTATNLSHYIDSSLNSVHNDPSLLIDAICVRLC